MSGAVARQQGLCQFLTPEIPGINMSGRELGGIGFVCSYFTSGSGDPVVILQAAGWWCVRRAGLAGLGGTVADGGFLVGIFIVSVLVFIYMGRGRE